MWAPRRPSTSDGSKLPVVEEAAPAEPSVKVKNPGRRYAQIVKLKPEHIDEYKKVHAAVWPDVLKQIKDCKIEDCAFPSFLYVNSPTQTIRQGLLL